LRLRLLIPLAVFALLVVFLGKGLLLNPSEVPSPLIDKPAPGFNLPRLHDPVTEISNKDMAGKVWMLNVWASWCVSCRQEHPLLVDLSRRGIVPIYGLNYKDTREEAIAWLQQLGNPYLASAFDVDGRVGLDYGVYGVPETYVIDAQGVIRYKQIGPISPDALQNKILPLIRELQGQA
jgi:cytochrome c biogenesis protein CcmG/thiol:disulfide interchange protein DsbE